jgi:hypothetical protein
MGDEWWADVSGQIVAGLIVIAVASGVAVVTPWGKRVVLTVGRAASAILSLRITTRGRIDAEVARAVKQVTAMSQEKDEHDVGPQPLSPEAHDGWVLGPATRPRHWELRNQTGRAVIVRAILFSGPYWPFEWEEPDFPASLAPGESLLIQARRVHMGSHLMPWVNDAMANVLYEDDHGDERQDVIWVLD